MSCQVKLTAALNDIPAIKRHLFPTDDSRGYFFLCLSCKNWFFAVVFHCFLGGDSWLQQCHVSVCPTGELIALANGKRLIVLSAKWDSTSGLSQFQISYAGMPDENDVIKAVICLPIVGQSQSSHVSFYGLG